MTSDIIDLAANDGALELVVACLRPLTAPDRVHAIAQAATTRCDPDRLVDLAQRHRVTGFVEQGLAAIGHILPDGAASRLARSAAASRVQSVRNAGEEIRIGRAFAAAGVDAVFIKGSTLAMRAHGALAIKTAWDIDVLVRRDTLAQAGAVLTALGYRLAILDGIVDPVHVRRYLDTHKEAEWRHETRNTVIELHTELSDNPAAIPSIGLASERDNVELMPGAALATLAPVPLFAYLAFHGTSHLWARLKWLADIAALLAGADVEELHRQAVTLGAGRCPGVAIVLAHELLGLEVPASLLDAIQRDRATRRLIRYSQAAIAAPTDGQDRLRHPFGEMVASARAQGWLVPGIGFRWRSVRRFMTQPYLPMHLRMPNWIVPVAIVSALPVRLLLRPARLRRPAGEKIVSTP